MAQPPLEVVRKVRAHALDQAIDAHRAAEQVEAQAARRLEEAVAHTRAVRNDEHAALATERRRLDEGGSPGDHAQLAAFVIGSRLRIERAEAAERAARAELDRAAAVVAERRRATVEARAALAAIEKHQASARERAQAAADASLDEAAAEAHAARRVRG
jgi:hypothetical protein